MALLPFIGSFGPYSNVRAPQGYGYANNWTLANRIIYVPIRLPEQVTVKRIWWANGGNTTGDVNVGLYSQGGIKQWETGSTAKSGSNTIQFVDIDDAVVAAGRWLIAMQASSASSSYIQYIDGVARLWGVLTEDAAGFALPDTASFASDPATNYLPHFGFDLRG